MTLFIALLVLWVVATLLVTHLFCAAAREFVSTPEMPMSYVGTIQLRNHRG